VATAYVFYITAAILAAMAIVVTIVAISMEEFFFLIFAVAAGIFSVLCLGIAVQEHTEYDRWENARDWFIETQDPLVLESIAVNNYDEEKNLVKWYDKDRNYCSAIIRQGADENPPWALFNDSCDSLEGEN